MKNITVLGSTGSVGTTTLDVIRLHPQRFNVIALTANNQFEKLFEQCNEFKPRYAVLADQTAAEQLALKIDSSDLDTEVLHGESAIIKVAELVAVDYVIAAIVGAKGLLPTLAAVKAGKKILLANKEALVMAGALFKEELASSGAVLLPIDSEHNAIFQCLPGTKHNSDEIVKVIITASGGPFRNIAVEQLDTVTPEQACAHPIWKMGRKISVDSATMMNKGLEVIEAHWLFDLPVEKIAVILHPQSTIHSLVEYQDGSMLAQLGNPDMRIPIAYALSWPERIASGASQLDLLRAGKLEFEPVSAERYPCLNLAYQALNAGGTTPTVLNAANEIAVDAFLKQQIRFTDIYPVISEVLEQLDPCTCTDIDNILRYDYLARQKALAIIEKT